MLYTNNSVWKVKVFRRGRAREREKERRGKQATKSFSNSHNVEGGGRGSIIAFNAMQIQEKTNMSTVKNKANRLSR